MGTLSSELGPILARTAGDPRVYADANVPLGLVTFMRQRLRWDVYFVLEHPDLRRARDIEHFRLAREMRRTLVTDRPAAWNNRNSSQTWCNWSLLTLRRSSGMLISCNKGPALISM